MRGVRTENSASNKPLYKSAWPSTNSSEALASDNQTVNYVFNFCYVDPYSTVWTADTWWMIDLIKSSRIDYVEITPQLGSLCPENSQCGRTIVVLLAANWNFKPELTVWIISSFALEPHTLFAQSQKCQDQAFMLDHTMLQCYLPPA